GADVCSSDLPASASAPCRWGWAARCGSTTPTSASTTTCATPRCPGRAATPSCSAWSVGSCPSASTAASRCGRCGWSRAWPRTGGRSVAKVHHCLVDGVSGAELLAVTLDLGPEPPPVGDDPWRPEPLPSPVRLARDAAVDLATSPYEQARAAGAVLRRPGRLVDAAREVLRG